MARMSEMGIEIDLNMTSNTMPMAMIEASLTVIWSLVVTERMS